MRPIEKVEKNKILDLIDKTALRCRHCRVDRIIDEERSVFCCEYIKGSFFSESCTVKDEIQCRHIKQDQDFVPLSNNIIAKQSVIGAIRRKIFV